MDACMHAYTGAVRGKASDCAVCVGTMYGCVRTEVR